MGASAAEVLSAVAILVNPAENKSKMATPVKSDAGGPTTPRGHDSADGNAVVKIETPEGGAAALAGGWDMDGRGGAGGGGGTPTPRQTVTRVTANSLELHKIKEQARRAREKQLLARLQSLLFDGRESPPSASGMCVGGGRGAWGHVLQDDMQPTASLPFVR